MAHEDAAQRVRLEIEHLYRTESRRVLATLIRLLGDFDLAEEALHDAFHAAIERWPTAGVPANPRAWLISTGRFRSIDRLRRRARFDASQQHLVDRLEADLAASAEETDAARSTGVADDRLRLIFTCCHPALPADARSALTLREVCGLTTEAIAHAYLTSPTTLAQRIVRAKAKIRLAGIPYQLPAREDLAERLDAVLQVVYLIFNEGYYASSGSSLLRADLSQEAIRLGRLLVELIPESEVMGLLALMLLHDARRATRLSADGRLVLLDDQDRSRWDRAEIQEGAALVHQALSSKAYGAYTLQAAIAAVHAEADSPEATSWVEIVGLYSELMRVSPSPIVELNQAVAIAMRDGPSAGLARIDALFARGELTHYALAHAARADLCRRLGLISEARAAYVRARQLTEQDAERDFLEQRIASLDGSVE